MQIKTIIVGPLYTNCYILINNNKCIIIDPGDDFELIKETVKDYQVVGCLITHHHDDHIGALQEVLNEYNIKENIVNDKDFNYEVIKTPGHTSDSISFYFKEINTMFSGDFIFYHNIGRTDLGGNNKDMLESLNMISSYPDDIKINPGHGPSTILGEEKKYFSYYL